MASTGSQDNTHRLLFTMSPSGTSYEAPSNFLTMLSCIQSPQLLLLPGGLFLLLETIVLPESGGGSHQCPPQQN